MQSRTLEFSSHFVVAAERSLPRKTKIPEAATVLRGGNVEIVPLCAALRQAATNGASGSVGQRKEIKE